MNTDQEDEDNDKNKNERKTPPSSSSTKFNNKKKDVKKAPSAASSNSWPRLEKKIDNIFGSAQKFGKEDSPALKEKFQAEGDRNTEGVIRIASAIAAVGFGRTEEVKKFVEHVIAVAGKDEIAWTVQGNIHISDNCQLLKAAMSEVKVVPANAIARAYAVLSCPSCITLYKAGNIGRLHVRRLRYITAGYLSSRIPLPIFTSSNDKVFHFGEQCGEQTKMSKSNVSKLSSNSRLCDTCYDTTWFKCIETGTIRDFEKLFGTLLETRIGKE
jgi:hypothetical protein